MPKRIPHPVSSSAYREAHAEPHTYIITTDDPTYYPPSAGQLQEIEQLVHELRSYMQATISKAYSVGEMKPGSRTSTERLTEDKFNELAQQWRSQVAFCSTVLEMAILPVYQQIIGMGRPAIPYILRDLSRQPDHWFWALKAITGVDPVPEEDGGDLEKMTQAWLLWGARNGYEW